ncbi:ApeA N-terminal domain 1-containing protein [Nocardia africana]|uniref:HEPN domain-containing protein n=1 Tax=Nocardia africana TaxID=134964 RepID=A0ABW6NE00_9NOCA
MTEHLQNTMSGTAGYFWDHVPRELDLETSLPGYVQLQDDGYFHIVVVTSHVNPAADWDGNDRDFPNSIVGMTNVRGSLFFDFAGMSESNIIGATRASTRTFKTRSSIVGISLDELKSDNIRALSARMPNLTNWSGINHIKESFTKGDDQRLKSWSGSVDSTEPIIGDIGSGLRLSISTSWSVSGPSDSRIVAAPLVISTESKRPRHWADLIGPLVAVQDLINLAYKGHVVANSGTATLDLNPGYRPSTAPDFWSDRLMRLPKGSAPPTSMDEFPAFNLSHIGGMKGIRAWIKLDKDHPRATGPLANAYRYGRPGAEMRLMEVALGIEYWTKANNKLKWAKLIKDGGKTEKLPNALSRKVGKPFSDFVGNATVWSNLFWDTYNSLKHAPNFEYDADDIYYLGESGALLLEAALLNRVAGNGIPARAIFTSHRNHAIGNGITRLVALNSPK